MAFAAWLPAAAAAPCEPAFRELRFEARKALVLSAEVSIEARALGAGPAREDLRACPDGPAAVPEGDCLVLLDAVSEAPFHHAQELTWLEPGGAGVLQVLKARRGRRWRLLRRTEDGHHRWTRRPDGRKESRRGVDDWSRRTDEHVPWELSGEPAPATSGYALLHQAMAGRLDREGAASLFLVHAKGRLLEVRLEAAGLVEVEASYLLRRPGEVRRVKGRRSLRRVVVSGRAVGADEEGGSAVGLLGMSSDVELFLEPGTGLPVELRGVVDGAGALRVRLAEARLP